jgi:hypothetical protein
MAVSSATLRTFPVVARSILLALADLPVPAGGEI